MTVTWTCTGCALLCDDILVHLNSGRPEKVEHACLRGKARLFGCKRSALPMVADAEVELDTAIHRAGQLLREAKYPLLFGWSNSTSEAQLAGIELAGHLGATMDSTSSFCQGITVSEILKGSLPSCTLEDVREKADVIIFWGADPMSAHPRHLSRYAYYPRGELRQRGYEEDRIAISIDVRQSRTAKISKNMFFQIPPGGDAEFILALMSALSGKVPRLSFDFEIKRILELAAILKKAQFGVIFAGLGLIYSIQSRKELLVQLMNLLNNVSSFHLIPMTGHFNMRGFNHNMFHKTGHVHRVRFTDNGIRSGLEYSVIEQLKTETDVVLVIGTDPLTSLPGSISKRLKDLPVILIDPCKNLTSHVADVVIPSAITGIGSGGTAVRLDGKTVTISPLYHGSDLSDEQIIGRLIEEVS